MQFSTKFNINDPSFLKEKACSPLQESSINIAIKFWTVMGMQAFHILMLHLVNDQVLLE